MREPLMRAVTGAGFFLIGILSGTSSDAQFPEIAEGERYMLQTRVVNRDTGEPAAGVEVSWIGYRGEEQCIISAADGSLAAPLGGVFGWATLLYGRRDGLVTQALFLLGEASLRTELVLGTPASLTGTIQREDGKPLEGGTVRLKANPHCVKAHFETRTDGEGRYAFENLPPGSYYVQVGHESYFAPASWSTLPPSKVSLSAGETASYDFLLREKAHLAGRVIGPDGAGAGGVTFRLPDNGDYGPERSAITDEVGNFEVRVIPYNQGTRDINVESSTFGSGSFSIPPTKPGDIVRDITVQLHGVARVTGTVRGPNGEPVVDVRVEGVSTNESGHYDTGFVALPAKGNLNVSVEAPIWREGLSVSRMSPVAPQLASDAVYYKDSTFTLAAKHGDVISKDVVLERIPVKTLRGSVQDVNGGPAARVMVAIYAGPAPARFWLEDLAPFTPPPPAKQPQMPYQTFESSQPAILLARVPTDDQGEWEVRVLSKNKYFSWLTGERYMNLQELTIAAADATLERTALKRVKHFDIGDAPIESDLILEPVADDLMTHAYVTDEAGTPLPGVAWVLNGINGPFSTDKDGRVALPRIASRAYLKLVDTDYSIVSAKVSGEIVEPPRPTSDPEPRGNSDFGGFGGSISGSGIETAAPYLKTDERAVAFHVFDSDKGKLVISLKHVVGNTALR